MCIMEPIPKEQYPKDDQQMQLLQMEYEKDDEIDDNPIFPNVQNGESNTVKNQKILEIERLIRTECSFQCYRRGQEKDQNYQKRQRNIELKLSLLS